MTDETRKCTGSQRPAQNPAPQPVISVPVPTRELLRRLWGWSLGSCFAPEGRVRARVVSHPPVPPLWFKLTCFRSSQAATQLSLQRWSWLPLPTGPGGVPTPPAPGAAPQLWQSLGRRRKLAPPPRGPAQVPLPHPPTVTPEAARSWFQKQTKPGKPPHHPWETSELLSLVLQPSRAPASLRASVSSAPRMCPPCTGHSVLSRCPDGLSASNTTPSLLPPVFARTPSSQRLSPPCLPLPFPRLMSPPYSGFSQMPPPPGRPP